ncbi:hypothetical protein GIB67_002942 [Kingdonia uniflora]|uniref:Nudix hydrolase domain-containing protein n=1 Tax=Kingdonia uniflora TaxID=39325 RepID=A0A7J7M8N9_9MAGN|nr:hypothetical protein GIB67_002942 [Kingdonia uniflora]
MAEILKVVEEEELFDVLTKTGQKTGITKPRQVLKHLLFKNQSSNKLRLVHKDGDYHRAVNVWIYAESTQELLLQRRSDCKDSWPGLWDISSAGHISAGDSSLLSARSSFNGFFFLFGPLRCFSFNPSFGVYPTSPAAPPSFAALLAPKPALEPFVLDARFSHKEGMPVVTFSPNGISCAEAAFFSILAMTFSAGIPPIGDIRTTVYSQWGLLVMLKMESERDVVKGLTRESHMVWIFC